MNRDNYGALFSNSNGTVSGTDLTRTDGVIASLAALDVSLDDDQLLENLRSRIDNAIRVWDESTEDGYNLTEKRRLNHDYFNAKQIHNKLRNSQIPYEENQIWIGWSAVLSYLTDRTAQPEVYPSDESSEAERFSTLFARVLKGHNSKHDFRSIASKVVSDAGMDYVGAVKLEFDPSYGKDGDIVPKLVDPENLIIDNTARFGENPSFIAYKSPISANEMIHRWKSKKADIMSLAQVQTEDGKANLDTTLTLTEVWFTYYDSDFEPCEGVAYYCENILLEKSKNPNYSYANEELNLLNVPPKPFVLCNITPDGRLLIDKTSPIEQARKMQDFLNIAGRHALEASLRSNPKIVVNGDTLNKEDAVNAAGMATQDVITLTNVPQGSNTKNEFGVIEATVVSPELLHQKIDLRTQVLALLGAPDVISGTGDNDDTVPTLGQTAIKKDQAEGRLDLMMRSIDVFYTDYYRLLAHMMSVWYTKKHSFVVSESDNTFKRVFISREIMDSDIEIHVQAGSTIPTDDAQQQQIAQDLLNNKAIDLLDYYKIVGMENPQELYDNFIKFTKDPQSLAGKEISEVDEFTAHQLLEAFEDVEEIKVASSSIGLIKAMRNVTVGDTFKSKSKKVQKRYTDFMQKTIRENLKEQIVDNAAKQGVMALEPDLKFTPTQIMAAAQGAGLGAPGGALDGQIAGAGQPQTPQAPQVQQPISPSIGGQVNAQGQAIAPNGQPIDPNHFYTIQELAQMGLSPQDMQAEAQRSQSAIQQSQGMPQSAPQQPQPQIQQQIPQQAPQPAQM